MIYCSKRGVKQEEIMVFYKIGEAFFNYVLLVLRTKNCALQSEIANWQLFVACQA